MAHDLPPPSYRPFGAFRFVLASTVLLQHGLVLLAPPDREVFYDLELGAVAVVAFFALSGFIVAEATQNFYTGRPAAFLVNRVLRVVPPYLAALVITVAADAWLYSRGILQPLVGTLHGSPLQPRVIAAAILEIVPGLPAIRISGQDFSFVPFAWTLRMEFAFYLAAFATCFVARHRRVGRSAGLIAFAAAYGAFWVFVLRGGQGPLQIVCVPFFAFGVGVFLFGRTPGIAAAAHLGFALGCSLLAFTYFRQHGHPIVAFQLGLTTVLFALVLVLSRLTAAPGPLRSWDRRLGELSYPLYISHGVVLTVLGSLSDRRGALPYALAIIVALLLAAGLHIVVEQPLRALRTRVRRVSL